MTDNVASLADARLWAEIKRRLGPPNGNCRWCRQPADRNQPGCGPLLLTLSDRGETLDGETLVHEFCCWECLGHWAAEQAGGAFVNPQTQ
jgi:hypothetical protein